MINLTSAKIKLAVIIGTGIAFIAAIGAIGYLYLSKQTLQSNLDLQTSLKNAALGKVKMQQTIITKLEDVNAETNKAQAALRQRITVVKKAANANAQYITKLERENEKFKQWSNTKLPDVVTSLRKRRAITGSEDYRDWLSSRDTMYINSDTADIEWRPAP